MCWPRLKVEAIQDVGGEEAGLDVGGQAGASLPAVPGGEGGIAGVGGQELGEPVEGDQVAAVEPGQGGGEEIGADVALVIIVGGVGSYVEGGVAAQEDQVAAGLGGEVPVVGEQGIRGLRFGRGCVRILVSQLQAYKTGSSQCAF